MTLEASLEGGEDAIAAVKALQTRAEGLVEDHKQGLLASIEELHQLTERQAEVRGLQKELQRAQDRLNAIRTAHPDLPLLPEGSNTVLGEQDEDGHRF